MIYEISGDLTTTKADIICHQTNYVGVMGAGVARAIASRLLPVSEYFKYVTLCRNYGKQLLGKVQYLKTVNPGQIVANCFCENQLSSNGDFTDYANMEKCLREVERKAAREHKTVAIPARMGCRIAGGDWAQVRLLIGEIFSDSPVTVTIVHWIKDKTEVRK